MANSTSTIGARATILADNGTGATCVVLHRDDRLFDLLRFNQQNAFSYRALPAAASRGLASSELLSQGDIIVDQSIITDMPVRLFNGDAPDEILAPRALRHCRVVDCCVDVPDEPPEVPDRARIDRTISAFTARRLHERLDETLEIPPLPAAAQRILALKSNPDYALADLVKVVETDPSIAARVMGWAGSAFYAANPPPRSLGDAIMRVLGFDIVMNLALGLALAGSLRLPDHHVRGGAPFWTEAVFTAAAMEGLSQRLPGQHAQLGGMSYLTGLLANYGTLILGHVFPPQYASICLLQEANPHLPARIIDAHVLDLPREILAAALFELWGLPEVTTCTVRHQNDPVYSGDHASSVRLLQTARALMGYGDGTMQLLEEDRLQSIGIATRDLSEVSALLNDSRDELEGLARAVA